MNRTVPAAKAAFVFLLAGAAACQQGGLESAQSAPLETDDQKASYAIGLQVGGSLVPAADMIEMTSFLRGVQDALAQRDPAVEQAELQMVMQSFGARVEEVLRPLVELPPDLPVDRALARLRTAGQRVALVGDSAHPRGLVGLMDLMAAISGLRAG